MIGVDYNWRRDIVRRPKFSWSKLYYSSRFNMNKADIKYLNLKPTSISHFIQNLYEGKSNNN